MTVGSLECRGYQAACGSCEWVGETGCGYSNAGVLTQEWTTVDGMETTIAVNAVRTILLGLLLLPKMRESARKHGSRGRMAFVGSDIHYIEELLLNLEDLSPGVLGVLS